MNLQNISLVAAVLFASCYLTLGFSVQDPRLGGLGTKAPPPVIIGPEVAALINSIIQILPNPLQLKVSEVPINLTAATANSSLKIKGSLNLKTINLHNLRNLDVTQTSLVFEGLISIPLNVSLDSKRLPLYISADYSIDALVAGIIPIRGQGLLNASLDSFSFGCTGEFYALGSMTLKNFDTAMDISTLKVSLGGLFGDAELADNVGRILADLVVVGVKDNKWRVVDGVTKAFDGLKMTLKDLLDLLGP